MPPKRDNKFKKMFDKIDTDEDGLVGKQEIRDFADWRGMPERKVKKLNKQLDKIDGEQMDIDRKI